MACRGRITSRPWKSRRPQTRPRATPRADHFPHMEVELTEDPTKGNALRVKGGGEAGITPSSAVLMNAVMDALSGFGIEHIDMPATPQRVWRAIRDARNGAMQGSEG